MYRPILGVLILMVLGAGNALAAPVLSDWEVIASRIAARQHQAAPFPVRSLDVITRDNRLVFADEHGAPGTDDEFWLEDGMPVRHSRVVRAGEEYRFSATLSGEGRRFQSVIEHIQGTPALVFFNDHDVLVYTQAVGPGGGIELKEWLYARKPNIPGGSRWDWVFKPDPWQWPLTLDLEKNGTAVLNRHVPMAGIPIDEKARSNYMLQTRLKFESGAAVKQYFPFADPLAGIPVPQRITRDGVARRVDTGVWNNSVFKPHQAKPHALFDFKAWDDLWQSVYRESVSAGAEEYPLLIEN